MSRHHLLLLGCVLVALSAVGCRRGSSAPPANGDDQAPAQRTGTTVAETGQVTVDAQLLSNGHVSIAVTNGTRAPVELRTQIRVEQEDGDEWRQLESVGDIWIRENCETVDGVLYPDIEGEPCQQIPALTRIDVQPWFGTLGDAQCACERCTGVPAGRYRILVYGCEGQRFESMPLSIRLREDEE